MASFHTGAVVLESRYPAMRNVSSPDGPGSVEIRADFPLPLSISECEVIHQTQNHDQTVDQGRIPQVTAEGDAREHIAIVLNTGVAG